MNVAVAAALAQLFGLLGVGWALQRWRDPGPQVPDGLTYAVTEVTMPALILATLSQRALDPSLFGAVIASLLGLAAAFGAAHLLAPALTLPGATRGTFLLAATFCNTGFLGIPVALALWGPGSAGLTTAVMVDSVTTTILLNSVGVLVALRHGTGAAADGTALHRLLRTPMFLAALLGIGLQLAHLPLPVAVLTPLAWLGSATTVLVFLATGMRLRFGAIFTELPAIAGVCFVRFGVAPLVTLIVARMLHVSGETGQQAILGLAMPTAMMAPVVAARYAGPSALGPAAVAATTALTPLALLFWLALGRSVGL